LVARGDGAAVRELCARAYHLGRAFHAAEVRGDPKLLKWITRPNYFDRYLPEGWEKLAPRPKRAVA
jgi:hypothetical protein